MGKIKLSREELDFLNQHGLSVDDVHQSASGSRKYATEEAKRAHKRFLLGSPCEKAGHRIRTTKGHCIQCNPTSIAHHLRYRSEGYVYLAYSQSTMLAKIGMTESADSEASIMKRQASLRRGAYGGKKDWEIVLYFATSEAGKHEKQVSGLFTGKRVYGHYYEKDGRDQQASEMYETSRGKAETIFITYARKNKFSVYGFAGAGTGAAGQCGSEHQDDIHESKASSGLLQILMKWSEWIRGRNGN